MLSVMGSEVRVDHYCAFCDPTELLDFIISPASLAAPRWCSMCVGRQRWKESRTDCPAFLSKFIAIGGDAMYGYIHKFYLPRKEYSRTRRAAPRPYDADEL